MEEQAVLAYNPWAILLGEVSPTIQFEKRGRGRPRKEAAVVGKIKHKMGDREAKERKIEHLESLRMVERFKSLRESFTLTQTLNMVATEFKISYTAAYHQLSSRF